MYTSMEMPGPSKNLRSNIIADVQRYERRRARLHLLMGVAGVPLSIWGIVLSVGYVGGDLAHSSFYQYFSLLFSDTDVVLSYWREFAFSLAEAVPFIGIMTILAACAALLMSIRACAVNLRDGLTPSFTK